MHSATPSFICGASSLKKKNYQKMEGNWSRHKKNVGEVDPPYAWYYLSNLFVSSESMTPQTYVKELNSYTRHVS
jgi:hypothetical protein